MALHLENLPYPQMSKNKDFLDTLQQSQQIRNSRMNAESMYNLKNAQTQNLLDKTKNSYYNDAGMPSLARLWHRISTIQQDPALATDPSKQQELAGYQQVYQTLLSQQQALTGRNVSLAQTQAYRPLSGPAKLTLDQEMAAQGMFPSAATGLTGQQIGTQTPPTQNPLTMMPPLSEQQLSSIDKKVSQLQSQGPTVQPSGLTQQQIAGSLKNALLKSSVPAKTINRLAFGLQVETLLPQMLQYEPAMEYYSGIAGRSRLAEDALLSAMGNDVPKYNDYLKYQALSEQVAEQLTNFWGTSITPEMQKKLANLTNPSSLLKGPKAARAALNAALTGFSTEMNKLRSETGEESLYEEQQPALVATGKTASLPRGLKEEDITHYMNEHMNEPGWTRDEIIKRYEIKYGK